MYREDSTTSDNIYENTDVPRGTYGKEITDSKTSNRSTELTGCDCAEGRSSRAALVCLVLLCSLLLTAVIVLAVTLNQEKQQLKFVIDNLTREGDQLKWEKSTLHKGLDQVDGWTYYQSSFYLISLEKKNWSESKRYCLERGADLIIINNKEEQGFVRNFSLQVAVWIGLTKSNEGDRWKWADGTNVTSGFSLLIPVGNRSTTGNESCALTYSSGWTYYPCSGAFKWICEKTLF